MSHSSDIAFVAEGQIPPSPPPASEVGPIHWLRLNLFNSPLNAVLTLMSIALVAWIIPPLVQWAFIDSVWAPEEMSLKGCRATNPDGACWAVVNERLNQFIFGFYPSELYWRPVLAFILFAVALAPVLLDKVPRKMLWFTLAYPVIAFILILGGFGLEPVETARLGGFLLTMIIGVVGISGSLPLGILLALGRKSDLLIVKSISIGFIELIRGVPLITLLFVASTLLNYFLPPGTNFDLLVRVLIMVTLFASAYMAETIRGGLAALPQGQYEAADALGLDYWKSMRLIILPQALKVAIPGIVSSFIGLFKDSTLVLIIGMLDPLGIITPIRADSAWNGIVWELYVFVALFFFICCFSMSRYSMYLEGKLKTDR
jgi:general L-amino acid transport system permease protein